MNNTVSANKWLSLLLLAPLVLLTSLAMDIYVPAIPELINAFKTNPSSIQSTLSGFLIVFAAAQLLLGPISDQYGRKVPAIISSLIFNSGHVKSLSI